LVSTDIWEKFRTATSRENISRAFHRQEMRGSKVVRIVASLIAGINLGEHFCGRIL
jgi:predicted secreted protein